MPKIIKTSTSGRRNGFSARRPSPYARNPNFEKQEEWEKVQCPVCFDHPHNAVLLICSSNGKGCRPYMCNTIYGNHQPNCFLQFCNSRSVNPVTSSIVNNGVHGPPLHGFVNTGRKKPQLVCPFCRGQILGWVVAEDARIFMNSLVRDCPLSSCDFSGKYSELIEHLRLQHSPAGPSSADQAPINPSQPQQHINIETIHIALRFKDPVPESIQIYSTCEGDWGVEAFYKIGNKLHFRVKLSAVGTGYEVHVRADDQEAIYIRSPAGRPLRPRVRPSPAVDCDVRVVE